jgi:hypothetical protein
MELAPYVESLQRELSAAAAVAGDDDVRRAADRLLTSLDAAIRLVLIDALAAAAEQITAELAPGSVELRLRGRDPEFVVQLPAPQAPPAPPPPPPPPSFDADEATTARISLRLPDGLKARIEEAANSIGASVNSWLVHAINDAVVQDQQRPSDAPSRSTTHRGKRLSGWVR